MSEEVELVQSLEKLKDNNYALDGLTSMEYEMVLKNAPAIINAVSNMGAVGSKSQENVYNTIDKVIEIFSEQLKNPNLSDEARDKLNDRIERMVEKSFQKDSEFKRWMGASIAAGVGSVALLAKNPEVRKTLVNLLTKNK
ncbi:hypothetical protein EVJ29_12840 [Exiguobacterium sp. SH4S7]|uniref:hypothetical protein n=1 Tax=Exiguobacterium sp. SH4S7 TaxID=2510958 RepID=UPI00103B4448|nr:hypothetical protein [Exiguobacterium sp. SH4S7]TCI34104.1 hypothetical protein EVJ29_12840 [Exiguobacterium sp. SH4S7]